MIEVLKPGFFTTVQDRGRAGFRKFGMPEAGVMDTTSFRLANWLVGNPMDEAVFELTITGFRIKFSKTTYVGITGAAMSPKINGKTVEMYSTLEVKKGDILSFGKLESGCRTYVAVQGALEVEDIMNSKSTYFYGKTGGFKGRNLQKGDCIGVQHQKLRKIQRTVPEKFQLVYTTALTVRVTGGLEKDFFDVNALEKFHTSEFTLSNQSNRMGYRTEGQVIERKNTSELISSGIVRGTVQIPSDGQPIIMMADAQTNGGYPRIANIIKVDLDHLAQQKPGDRIRFKEVSVQEAQQLLIARENRLEQLLQS